MDNKPFAQTVSIRLLSGKKKLILVITIISVMLVSIVAIVFMISRHDKTDSMKPLDAKDMSFFIQGKNGYLLFNTSGKKLSNATYQETSRSDFSIDKVVIVKNQSGESAAILYDGSTVV